MIWWIIDDSKHEYNGCFIGSSVIESSVVKLRLKQAGMWVINGANCISI